MKPLNVAVLGCGVVGSQVVRLLNAGLATITEWGRKSVPSA